MAPRSDSEAFQKSPSSVSEQELWASMDPLAWHYSIARDSVFEETYKITRDLIAEAAEQGGYDCILECGCGTGDVIGNLKKTKIHRIGIDINERFIEHCKKHHSHPDCDFLQVDIVRLTEWWDEFKVKSGFRKPLVICVNNTLNIMPEEIRGQALEQMLAVAGDDGRVVLSYWNGHFFSHAIMNYYKENEELCGPFDFSHVDFETRTLEAPSGYSTHWMNPTEVQRLLRSFDINVDLVSNEVDLDTDHIHTAGLAIFCWFSLACTSKSKSYYDSDDAQTFYSSIWGEETVHIGRYDLLTDEQKQQLSFSEQISKVSMLRTNAQIP